MTKYYADGQLLLFIYVFCDYHFQNKAKSKNKHQRCGWIELILLMINLKCPNNVHFSLRHRRRILKNIKKLLRSVQNNRNINDSLIVACPFPMVDFFWFQSIHPSAKLRTVFGRSNLEVPVDVAKGKRLLSRNHRLRDVTGGEKGRIGSGNLWLSVF